MSSMELGYPKVEIHNFLGYPELSEKRIIELAKRDLIILSNRYINDFEGVERIKHINPSAKVLIYFIMGAINFGEVHPLTNDLEVEAFKDKGAWWLTYKGTQLSVGINALQKEIAVQHPDPIEDEQGVKVNLKYGNAHMDGTFNKEKLFVQGDVLVCENELMVLAGANNNKLFVQRGYLNTKAAEHPAGSRISAVFRPGWARIEEYFGVGMSETLELNMTDEAPLINGTRPNLYKADLFADNYYDNKEWRALFDGVFWDMAMPRTHNYRQIDPFNNNDPVDARTAHYLSSKGISSFFKRLRERTGDFIHVGNMLSQVELWDVHKYANGSQQEGFLFADSPRLKGDANNDIITHEMSTYRGWTYESRKPSIVWNTCQPEVPNNYRALRYSLCNTLLYDGYYQYRIFTGDCYNYKYWYDEYWVDKEGNPSAADTHRGWLGLPKGDALQLTRSLDTTDVMGNPEWYLEYMQEYAKTAMSSDKGTMKITTGPLKIKYRDIVTLKAKIPEGLKPGGIYTISFAARASKPRLVNFSIRNPSGTISSKIHFRVFLHSLWEQYTVSTVNMAQDHEDLDVLYEVGVEEGELFLKDFRIQEGQAELGWKREYENGLVLVNPTNEPQTIEDLGNGVYMKIRGKQDPLHNDGMLVEGCLTVPPKDGYVLVRVKQ